MFLSIYRVPSPWRRPCPLAHGDMSKSTAPQPTTCKTAEELLLTIDLGLSCLRHPLHGHSYARFTAFRPHACRACGTTIWGVFTPACTCLNCGVLVHRRCAQKLTTTPCGMYRGLRDPQGALSPGRRTPSPAVSPSRSPQSLSPARPSSPPPPSSIAARRVSSPFQSMRASFTRSPTPASTAAAMRRFSLTGPSSPSPSILPSLSAAREAMATSPGFRMLTGDAGRPSSSPVPKDGAAAAFSAVGEEGTGASSPARRRSTYETLTLLPAVVGGILGGIAGGPAGSLMAAKIGQATSLASSTFTMSGFLAGAVVGYRQGTREGGVGEEALESVWSGLAAAARRQQGVSRGTSVYTPLEGEGEGDFMDRLYAEPTALPHRLWRRFRPRFVRAHGAGGGGVDGGERRGSTDSAVSEGSEDTAEGQGEGGGKSRTGSLEGRGAVNLLEKQMRRETEGLLTGWQGIQDGVQEEAGEGGAGGEEGRGGRGSSPPQQADPPALHLQASDNVPPPQADPPQASCHGPDSSFSMEPRGGEVSFHGLDSSSMAPRHESALQDVRGMVPDPSISMAPRPSALQDVRGMVHELVVAMLDCHPPWRGQAASVERVLAFVEAAVLGDDEEVYGLVLGEVAEATAIADRRLEGWLDECRGGMAQCDEAALQGDERIGKAALALQAMVGERTGARKLQAVTQAVMALGQGDLGLTPDELLPLLVLSVRQAEVANLYAELAFIEEFSDVRQLLGAEGYAYVSVQAALQSILPPSRAASLSPELCAMRARVAAALLEEEDGD